jgi:tripartite-type tricarboxylate transporter receptor subunit TctC
MTASGWVHIIPVICTIVVTEFACAQNFPTKPIRLITSAAGGSSDFASRLIAQGLATGLGQQVLVDNRGGGVVPVEIVAKSPADGYTMLYYGSTLWLLPLMQDVSYDALRDFAPVSIAVNSPTIVAVHPSLPVKSIKDLIALAKAKPGVLNYGSASPGSPTHLATELFKVVAGVSIVAIPFNGTGPALNAAVSGEVQVLMAPAGGIATQVNSGRLRALAMASAKRSPSFPNLPTVAEAGLPGYEYGQFSGIFAPAKTPAAIIDRLSVETARVVNRADVKEKFFSTGTDVDGSTPQEATAKIKSEIARLGKVIKDAKIRVQ